VVPFRQEIIELHRCENHVLFLPVNILTVWCAGFLGCMTYYCHVTSLHIKALKQNLSWQINAKFINCHSLLVVSYTITRSFCPATHTVLNGVLGQCVPDFPSQRPWLSIIRYKCINKQLKCLSVFSPIRYMPRVIFSYVQPLFSVKIYSRLQWPSCLVYLGKFIMGRMLKSIWSTDALIRDFTDCLISRYWINQLIITDAAKMWPISNY